MGFFGGGKKSKPKAQPVQKAKPAPAPKPEQRNRGGFFGAEDRGGQLSSGQQAQGRRAVFLGF